jgi:hypothetical protein
MQRLGSSRWRAACLQLVSSATKPRPATSDRDVTFANKLGELLKQKYPGKDYRVLMLSYGHSRPAPVKARPADNVIMTIVANFFGRTGLVDRGSTRGDTYRQQFEAWAKIVPSMFWRPNTGSPAGWQQGLPDIHVAQTIRDFKDVAAANCIGIYIDGVWEHWATVGPLYYIMAQLAWNPAADADAILSDYYTRRSSPPRSPPSRSGPMAHQALSAPRQRTSRRSRRISPPNRAARRCCSSPAAATAASTKARRSPLRFG